MSAPRDRRAPKPQGTGRNARSPQAPRSPRGSTRSESLRSGAGGLGGDQVEGRRAVQELLRAGRRPIFSISMARSRADQEIEALAAERNVPIRWVGADQLDALARTDVPQGVVARTDALEAVPVAELCTARNAFLLAIDHVTDPRNLGSIIRSAVQAGVTGIVLPKHRAALLTPTAMKAAAGAVEYVTFAASGIGSALDTAARHGVWTVGLDADGAGDLHSLAVAGSPVMVVAGSEGPGLSPLVRRRCDVIASIPMHGPLDSLNVGVATAIALFAIAQQRSDASVAYDS